MNWISRLLNLSNDRPYDITPCDRNEHNLVKKRYTTKRKMKLGPPVFDNYYQNWSFADSHYVYILKYKSCCKKILSIIQITTKDIRQCTECSYGEIDKISYIYEAYCTVCGKNYAVEQYDSPVSGWDY